MPFWEEGPRKPGFTSWLVLTSAGNPVPMPERLWKRLVPILRSKGIDASKFVSADEVMWKEKELPFTHTKSKKKPWVYSVLSINWHGDNSLYVSHFVSHGALAGGGSTLVLQKRQNKWCIIDRVQCWVSEHGDRNIPERTHPPVEAVGPKERASPPHAGNTGSNGRA